MLAAGVHVSTLGCIMFPAVMSSFVKRHFDGWCDKNLIQISVEWEMRVSGSSLIAKLKSQSVHRCAQLVANDDHLR